MNNGSLKTEPEHFRLITKSELTDNPTIPVSWCLTEAGKYRLLHRKTNPDETFVLVSVHHPTAGETDRYLFPINSGMGYVQFRGTGKNTLHASILWSDDFSFVNTAEKLENEVLNKSTAQDFNLNLYNHNTSDFNLELAFIRRFNCLGHSEVAVTVEKEFFAKEPPEWLDHWVNAMFNRSAADQCQFRRRAIFAFTLQPIIYALFFCLAMFIIPGSWIIFLACGIRGIIFNPKRLVHEAPWDDLNGSIFFSRHGRYKNLEPRPLFLRPLTPIFSLGLWLILEIIRLARKEPMNDWQVYVVSIFRHWPWYKLLGLSVSTMLGLSFVLLIIHLIGRLLRVGLDWLVSEPKQAAEKLEVDPEELARQQLAREQALARALEEAREAALDQIVCNGPQPLAYRELPKPKRTFALLFKETKAKVCRPYARA